MTAPERLTIELDAALIDYTAGIDRAVRFVTIDQVDMLVEFYLHNRATKAQLAKAVEEKLDAISQLNAWFDRRKLGHDVVDKAVVDAASGYLRTARSGGMSKVKSDLVLGVIQDMARLGLFADIFARAVLAEIEKGAN